MDKSEELGQEIASLSAHLDAATHRLLECIRRFDEAHGGMSRRGVVRHWLRGASDGPGHRTREGTGGTRAGTAARN